MANSATEAAAILRPLADQHDSILVAYSGGKDSLAVMDLCARTFKTVRAFHMEFLPGLRITSEMRAAAQSRFGVDVAIYLHPNTIRSLKGGVYCDASFKRDDWPEYTVADVYKRALADSGCRVCANGHRANDGGRRGADIKYGRHAAAIVSPITSWTQFDVLTYLAARNIPRPERQSISPRAKTTGVCLRADSILWLHDSHPDDYALVRRYFPYVEAVVQRRQFYGFPVARA